MHFHEETGLMLAEIGYGQAYPAIEYNAIHSQVNECLQKARKDFYFADFGISAVMLNPPIRSKRSRRGIYVSSRKGSFCTRGSAEFSG